MTAKELLEGTLPRLLEWIRAADAKVAPLLAIDTSMLAVLAALSSTTSEWTGPSASLAIGGAALLILSLFFLSLTVFPRTEGPKGSLLFFEGIKSRTIDGYLQDVSNVSENHYVADLAKQCHRNAQIASSKFKFVKVAMVLLLAAIIPWLTVIFMLYQQVPTGGTAAPP